MTFLIKNHGMVKSKIFWQHFPKLNSSRFQAYSASYQKIILAAIWGGGSDWGHTWQKVKITKVN